MTTALSTRVSDGRPLHLQQVADVLSTSAGKRDVEVEKTPLPCIVCVG